MMRATRDLEVAPAQWQAPLAQTTTAFAEVTFAGGVAVRGFTHQSYRLEAMPACRDHLLAYRLSGVAKAQRWLGGAVNRSVTRSGSITVIPALRESAWEIEGSGMLLYFFLPPELVRRVAEDEQAMGCGAASIVDRLGIHDQRIGDLALQFARELEQGTAGWSIYTEAITTQLAVLLARNHSGGGRRPTRLPGGMSLHVKRRVLDYVDANLAQDIALADLARVAGLAASHFSHSFRVTFGYAPYQYVLRERAHRARRLLETERMPLAEVALAAGFANQAHLTTLFKRVVGVTPAVYRASCATPTST